jgi:hypothetical protein
MADAVHLHFAPVDGRTVALLARMGGETYRGDLRDTGAEIALGGNLAGLPARIRRVIPDITKIALARKPWDPPVSISV